MLKTNISVTAIGVTAALLGTSGAFAQETERPVPAAAINACLTAGLHTWGGDGQKMDFSRNMPTARDGVWTSTPEQLRRAGYNLALYLNGVPNWTRGTVRDGVLHTETPKTAIRLIQRKFPDFQVAPGKDMHFVYVGKEMNRKSQLGTKAILPVTCGY